MSQKYKIWLVEENGHNDPRYIMSSFIPRKGDYLTLGYFKKKYLVVDINILMDLFPIECYVTLEKTE